MIKAGEANLKLTSKLKMQITAWKSLHNRTFRSIDCRSKYLKMTRVSTAST